MSKECPNRGRCGALASYSNNGGTARQVTSQPLCAVTSSLPSSLPCLSMMNASTDTPMTRAIRSFRFPRVRDTSIAIACGSGIGVSGFGVGFRVQGLRERSRVFGSVGADLGLGFGAWGLGFVFWACNKVDRPNLIWKVRVVGPKYKSQAPSPKP